MFEEQLRGVPAEPPRTELLPGLRFAALAPRTLWLLPLVLVAVFTVFPLMIFTADPAVRLALGPSRTIAARVLSVADANSCREAAHRIVYVFSPEPSHDVRGATVACRDAADYLLKADDTLDVKYLVSRPQLNRPVGNNRNEPPLFLFVFFPIMALLMFALLIVPRLREMLRARNLFRIGRITTGRVIFVKKRMRNGWQGIDGAASADVYIEYLRGAAPCEAVAWCSNEWLLHQLPPGASVHIAYRDDAPDRVALLDAFIR